jgi:hypothetical protein
MTLGLLERSQGEDLDEAEAVLGEVEVGDFVVVAEVLGDVAREGEGGTEAQTPVIVVGETNEDKAERLEAEHEVGKALEPGAVLDPRGAELDGGGREAEGEEDEAELLSDAVLEEDFGGEESERHDFYDAREELVEVSEALRHARTSCGTSIINLGIALSLLVCLSLFLRRSTLGEAYWLLKDFIFAF